MAIAGRDQDTGANIFIRLLTSRVLHVNEIVSAQGQAAGKPRPFEPHLMPAHGRRVEDVPLAANELTGVFKTPGDLTRLHDPPLRRSRMQMAKYRVGVERPGVGTAAAPATALGIRGGIAAIGILRIVGIGLPINGICEQVILQGTISGGVRLGGFKQVPMRNVGRAVCGR